MGSQRWSKQQHTTIMDILVSLLYSLIIAFIRFYKFIELQILKLFSPLLRRYMISEAEKIGIIFHLPGDPDFSPEEEETRIIKKCGFLPVFHLKINDLSFFPLLANRGTLAAGEGYISGIWEIVGDDTQITEFTCRLLENNSLDLYYHPINKFLHYLELEAFNLQTTTRAFQIANVHYDAGNDLIESYLGPSMLYSSGYFAATDNLEEAQIQKMELIANKLDFKPGMRVLDVGCGWGMLCKYLAENHGVECVGISVSKEGIKYGQQKCRDMPNVELRVQDYRDLNEKFDRIVSVECLEHLGPHNYRTFFKVMHNSLKEGGIFLLHCTGKNHKNMVGSDPFTHKYVFPNTTVPYYRDVCKDIEGLFIIEDWHNFGPDFGKTFKAWSANFKQNESMITQKYGETVYKLWRYYLLFFEATLKSRKFQLWQIVLSKNGLTREYRAAR